MTDENEQAQMLQQQQIEGAFIGAVPFLGVRRKKWSERTLVEKIYFWTKPTVLDPEFHQRILAHTVMHQNFLKNCMQTDHAKTDENLLLDNLILRETFK